MSVDWRQRGACRGADPELFFKQGPPSPKVQALCDSCPVLIRCTFDALRRPDHGYQAGLTWADRQAVRRWDREARARLASSRARRAVS